jgi:hypothetical protein
MRETDERTERLIGRHLDGELTADERHELNRELLRSAAARRMLSDYEANERLAAEVIGAAANGCWTVSGPLGGHRHGRRIVIGGAVLGGLAAAAVVMMAVGLPWQLGRPTVQTRVNPIASTADSPYPVVVSDDLVYTSTDLPHHGERRTHRDYVGVYDEAQGTLYMMELNRTRTVRVPVAGDL